MHCITFFDPKKTTLTCDWLIVPFFVSGATASHHKILNIWEIVIILAIFERRSHRLRAKKILSEMRHYLTSNFCPPAKVSTKKDQKRGHKLSQKKGHSKTPSGNAGSIVGVLLSLFLGKFVASFFGLFWSKPWLADKSLRSNNGAFWVIFFWHVADDTVFQL